MGMGWMGNRYAAIWRSIRKGGRWGHRRWRWGLAIGALVLAALINGLLPVLQARETPDTQATRLSPTATALPTPQVSPLPGVNMGASYTSPNVAVWNTVEEKMMLLSLEEYLVGVVAAEMPASFEPDALRAQAVAARTYTVRQMREFGGGGCDQAAQADMCSSSQHCQAWLSETARRDNWGGKQDENEAHIREAVQQTAGQVVVYEGRPIEALFHATSNGRTENVEEVYAQALPYLRSVTSSGEEEAPRFSDAKTFTCQEAARRINRKFCRADVSAGKLEQQLVIASWSQGGRVKEIQLNKITASGRDIRDLFELDSTSFTFSFSDSQITIHTTGYGHGVGMSQTGAQAMAQQGSGYVEILTHYYTGTQVVGLGELAK